MIVLSNGFSFELAVSSGALGFDGLGYPWEQPLRWARILRPRDFDVVVAKTVTAAPRKGNLSWWHPWTCVRWLWGDSAVNAVGLTNPGVLWWSIWYRKLGESSGVKLAASVQAESVVEARELAVHLRLLKLPFVEVNLSCPNVHDAGDRMVARDVIRCLGDEQPNPLVAKLSHEHCRRTDLIRSLEPHVDAFHAINSVPWDYLYPDVASPIEHHAHGRRGGVSGRAIHALALESVMWLRELTDRPIVGGGGIFTLEDIEDFRGAGASAYSLGSVFLRYPWRPNRLVRRWRKRHRFVVGLV